MGYRLFDYKCPNCGDEREALCWNDEDVICEVCKSVMVKAPSSRVSFVIPDYLGKTKVNRGPNIKSQDGSKAWNNS